MTTNSPNPFDGDVQALIEHIKAVIDEYERFGAGGMDEQVYRIALAALTAEPFEYLTLHQGCRAPDDCEIYSTVAEKGDKSDDGSDAIPVYTTPPAQPLHPVELPIKRRPWSCADSDNVLDYQETVTALRNQGYEVKS